MTEVKKHRYWLVFAATISILSFGCLKREDYPDEPSISFKRIDFAADSTAQLYLDFIDGDGNFGLEESDWDMSADSCRLRYNLFLRQYELRDGVWTDVTPVCDGLFYRVPWAKPTGQIKTQKGEIKINLFDFWYSSVISEFDTIRFEIYAVDRALNKSNVITTDYYLKP